MTVRRKYTFQWGWRQNEFDSRILLSVLYLEVKPCSQLPARRSCGAVLQLAGCSYIFCRKWVITHLHHIYQGIQMATCYRHLEGQKWQAYEQCVCRVEEGSIAPIVFFTSRGMGRATTVAWSEAWSLSFPPSKNNLHVDDCLHVLTKQKNCYCIISPNSITNSSLVEYGII